MASKIEDYGLIGNMETAAIVSRSGAIDWLCAPYFDSDACFSALLGYEEHGRWSLSPTVAVRENRQRYRDDTMILETDFICEGGAVRVTDFMPLRGGRCDLVRIEKSRWRCSSGCASGSATICRGSRSRSAASGS
jgi:GH15 family glucan-1,4-alpha-glucosidase